METDHKKTSLLAAAALASVALGGFVVIGDPGPKRADAGTSVQASEQRSQPASRSNERPSDTRTDQLGTRGYTRRPSQPRGKRYSASPRQHQRHVQKKRNQARHRASARG